MESKEDVCFLVVYKVHNLIACFSLDGKNTVESEINVIEKEKMAVKFIFFKER